MYFRCTKKRAGRKTYRYWMLVENHRTGESSRQKIVAYLGNLNRAPRQAVARKFLRAAEKLGGVTVSPLENVTWRNPRDYGDVLAVLSFCNRLGLRSVISGLMSDCRSDVDPALVGVIMVVNRLCAPRSKRSIPAWYARTALPDIAGLPTEKLNDARLYRCMDKLAAVKEGVELALRQRLLPLFGKNLDLLFYDITSTYFEGEGPSEAEYGYSRDGRHDLKQILLGLVVTRDGFPVAHDVFEGSARDSSTLLTMVAGLERRFGRFRKVLVVDRGMVTDGNLLELSRQGYGYIVGSMKSRLRYFEKELASGTWKRVREHVLIKECRRRGERYILCDNALRQRKDREKREALIAKLESELRQLSKEIEGGRFGRPSEARRHLAEVLLGHRSASRFVRVRVAGPADSTRLLWDRRAEAVSSAELQDGKYLLRTNVRDLSDEEIWNAYVSLNQAEDAFRDMKSFIKMRPIRHYRSDRVKAHVFVCVLAYLVLKTMEKWLKERKVRLSVKRVLEELHSLKLGDIYIRAPSSVLLHFRRVAQPNQLQRKLMEALELPEVGEGAVSVW